MILSKCFQKEWIQNLKDARSARLDIKQIERSIYAFELLGLLAKSGRDFVFKGGTSLMLLMPDFDRFSIDIDIIGMFSEDELNDLIKDSIFTHIEEDIRGKSKIPKKHYQFYYKTFSGDGAYVLLDMLDERVLYDELVKLPIKTDLFEVGELLKVKVPKIDEILCDKLAAFAPATIGIPYVLERRNDKTGEIIKTEKDTEILKQLFDIGRLFDHISNFESIKNTYKRIANQETQYRTGKYTIDEILKNTFQTALKICRIDLKGFTDDEESQALRNGISSVGSFLFSGRLSYDEAKINAAKAALLSMMIFKDIKAIDFSDYRYSVSTFKALGDDLLPREFGSLSRLKKMNPECFFFLFKISTITDDYSWVTE